MLVATGALAALLVHPRPATADITVEAALDRDVVGVNERITLTVTVMGSGRAATPELPELPDFAVFPAGSSRNFSFINGQMSSSTVYTYILAPRRQGTFTIPPIAVVDGNNRYISRPLEVRVEAGSSAPMSPGPAAPSPPPRSRRGGPADSKGVFVTAEVEPKSAYVGEQVTLTVRFYQGVRLLDRPDYRAPAATGFWVEQLPGERTYYTEVNGRKYHVTELRSALFATDAGELTIGPAEVECVIEDDPFARDPFSNFFSGFGAGERRTVRSQPISMNVRPLPREGRPGDWAGAVGKFRIESSLDLPRVHVGEAATLTVTLTGQGNIRAVGDPKVPEVAGLRAFDSGVTVDDRREGSVAGGVKKLTRVLIPEASGSYTVPAISISAFRPDLGRYETLRTNPLTLEVAEGGGGTSPVGATGGTHLLAASSGPNLRFIRTGDPGLRPRRGPPWESLGFWLLQLAPLGGLAAVELFARHREKVEGDTGYARHRRSAKEARRRLKEARAQLAGGEPRAFYGAVAQALLGYVSDRANLAAASLTATEARAELERRRIDPALIEAFTTCLERCDFGRFAPGADGARREVMAEAESLLRALPRAGL